MDRPSDSSRHHSVSLPGIRTLFPGIISGQRIFFQPKHSSNPTRSSLGYQRKKLPSSITHHPHSLISCPSFLLRAPFDDYSLYCSICRNSRFARYPAATTLAQPASRGLIQGPSTGGYPYSLLPLMAIAPLSHPHLLVTPSRPQSRPLHHALPISQSDPRFPLSSPNRKRPAFIPSVPRRCCLAHHRLHRQFRKTRVPVPTLHRRVTSALTIVSLQSLLKSSRTPEEDTRARTAQNVSTAPAVSPSM
jgi:hypothetical protein